MRVNYSTLAIQLGRLLRREKWELIYIKSTASGMDQYKCWRILRDSGTARVVEYGLTPRSQAVELGHRRLSPFSCMVVDAEVSLKLARTFRLSMGFVGQNTLYQGTKLRQQSWDRSKNLVIPPSFTVLPSVGDSLRFLPFTARTQHVLSLKRSPLFDSCDEQATVPLMMMLMMLIMLMMCMLIAQFIRL